MQTTLRATALQGVVALINELGGDPEALLSPLHIPLDIGEQEDGFLPLGTAAQLLEDCAARFGCAHFGLLLAQRQGLEILGPVAVIARNSDTVLDALYAIHRYLHIHSPAIQVEVLPSADGRCIQLDFLVTEPGLELHHQILDLSLGNTRQILKLLAGSIARPEEIMFGHRRQAAARIYQDFFQCPVTFDQPVTSFRLSMQWLNRRIDAADPLTLQIASRYLEAEFAFREQLLSTRVLQIMRRLMPTGKCTIHGVANHLCLHPRTLQRRLEEGAVFEDLLEKERRDCANRYLSDTGLQLSQVSGLLGYAEQSAFSRACRRWYGMAPSAYRNQLQQQLRDDS